MTSNNLLDPLLTRCYTSFGLRIADTRMLGYHFIDNNLVLVLLVEMGGYNPRTLFIGAAIPSSLGILVGGFKGELMLN
jgi:hypothetical protein